MSNLSKLLDQIETQIPFCETLNQAISQANVGWHIEHSLLTLNGITDSLAKSNPDNYTWKFNFIRIVVLTTKKIPRGRAKSPKVVQPKQAVNTIDLLKHLSETRHKTKDLVTMPKDRYFEHPFFGKLTLQQTINFLEIHTKHHLEIIKDIIKDR
jgi:DinB superfamily